MCVCDMPLNTNKRPRYILECTYMYVLYNNNSVEKRRFKVVNFGPLFPCPFVILIIILGFSTNQVIIGMNIDEF